MISSPTAFSNIEETPYAKIFCQNCKANSTCDHIGTRITQRNLYVLRYIAEFESGICLYPMAGTWEDQYAWFDYLFRTGRTHMKKLINDLQAKEMRR
jgi:hypothetical protein